MRGGYYWQPLLREFVKLFPETMVFTSGWPGFVPGAENAFHVRSLPGYRHVSVRRGVGHSDIGYEGYQWVSPSVLKDLMKFRPQVLFTSAFGLWTVCALTYKAMSGSRVIVLLDGISKATTNSRLRAPIRRVMARFVDAAVCNSGEGCDYLRDVVGISAPRIARRLFYVPDPALLRSEHRKEDQATVRPSFLFVGQLIRRKGWNLLIEAVNSLVNRGRKLSVTIVGDGQDKRILLNQISNLGLKEVVRAVGPVPYDQLGSCFEAADVFVLPSLEDTWGVVVSEAMACGKAVLCSRFAGASELIQDGVNGYVFNPHHPTELAAFMERFIQEPDLITRFGSNSRRIIADHTPQHAAERLGELVCGPIRSQDNELFALS
jgi:glycosyltransferase involved in cell wall biosynthesis